jgi:hypothetical protein
MVKSISDIAKYRKKQTGTAKRGRGRPGTVAVKVLVGLEVDDVARIDAWIAKQEKELGLKIGRGAAVRAVMRMGLSK